MTYECSICYAINHLSRTHCSACGSIPAMYSPIGKTVIRAELTKTVLVPIVAAHGCDRTERHRSINRRLVTVAADYYASE